MKKGKINIKTLITLAILGFIFIDYFLNNSELLTKICIVFTNVAGSIGEKLGTWFVETLQEII